MPRHEREQRAWDLQRYWGRLQFLLFLRYKDLHNFRCWWALGSQRECLKSWYRSGDLTAVPEAQVGGPWALAGADARGFRRRRDGDGRRAQVLRGAELGRAGRTSRGWIPFSLRDRSWGIGCKVGRLVGESDIPGKLRRFKPACGEDRKLTWETHGLSSSSYFYTGKLRPVESVQIARRLQNRGQPGLGLSHERQSWTQPVNGRAAADPQHLPWARSGTSHLRLPPQVCVWWLGRPHEPQVRRVQCLTCPRVPVGLAQFHAFWGGVKCLPGGCIEEGKMQQAVEGPLSLTGAHPLILRHNCFHVHCMFLPWRQLGPLPVITVMARRGTAIWRRMKQCTVEKRRAVNFWETWFFF